MIEDFMNLIWEESDIALIKEGTTCSDCGRDVNMADFRDDTSIDEYKEHGLCQDCLDNIPEYGDDEL